MEQWTIQQRLFTYDTFIRNGPVKANSHFRHSSKNGDDIADYPENIKNARHVTGSADPNLSVQNTTIQEANQNSIDKNQNNNKIELFINQHEQLTFKCDVNINFTNNIWLKDGEIVGSVLLDIANKRGASGHRYLKDREGNLLIDNVRLEDDGRWQCEAEDALGFVVTAKPILLTVLEPPRKPYLLIDNRRLDASNQFVPVKESAELGVQCVAEGGNPPPSLTWDLALALGPAAAAGMDAGAEMPGLNLTILEQGSTSSRLDIGGTKSEAHLRVMRAHHNATISCLVNHVTLKSPLTASLLLDVQYTPSFAISREPGFGIPIVEGMPLSLKCDVDSNPIAPGVWQKDDAVPPVTQSGDGFLNFTAIRREHSGWYKCTAKHVAGTFSSIGYFLNVRYEPDQPPAVMTQEPEVDVGELSSTGGGRQVEVALGGAVQLQCPQGTQGCWSRVNSNGAGEGGGQLEPLGGGQELRLQQVVYQEAGEYRCVAPASGRERQHRLHTLRTIQLHVTGHPTVFPGNQNATAVVGQPLAVTVEFCANPPYNRVFWISDRHIYYPGQQYPTENIIAHEIVNASSPHCHQSTLSWATVSVRDRGEHSFLVRSARGLAEGVVHVRVSHDATTTDIPVSTAPKIHTKSLLLLLLTVNNAYIIAYYLLTMRLL